MADELPESVRIALALGVDLEADIGADGVGVETSTMFAERIARLAIEESTRDLRAEVQAHEAVRDACFEALPECQVWGDVPGHIAELRAEKDGAYLERNHLVAALSKLYPSGLRRTNIPGWSDDWHGCCMIDLPSGQISYHFHDSHAHLFAHLKPYAGEWDGHDKEEVHARLGNLEESAQARELRERLERAQEALRAMMEAYLESYERAHALAIREAKDSAHD